MTEEVFKNDKLPFEASVGWVSSILVLDELHVGAVEKSEGYAGGPETVELEWCNKETCLIWIEQLTSDFRFVDGNPKRSQRKIQRPIW